MRKPIIAGNWKMNKLPAEAAATIKELAPLVENAGCDVVVCPTFVCLPAAVEAAKGTNIKIGAQNLHWKDNGAYTGEVTAEMLAAVGVEYVIIGHSERRQYYAETDECVNMKAKKALSAGLTPIVCVGEMLEQREQGITKSLCQYQTKVALTGLTCEEVAKTVIAYEPVWAIGTGKTATSEDANEVIGWIRDAVRAEHGDCAADAIRIQYGGSMKPSNAAELMAMPEIDGGLVGGASLVAADFSKVVNY